MHWRNIKDREIDTKEMKRDTCLRETGAKWRQPFKGGRAALSAVRQAVVSVRRGLISASDEKTHEDTVIAFCSFHLMKASLLSPMAVPTLSYCPYHTVLFRLYLKLFTRVHQEHDPLAREMLNL